MVSLNYILLCGSAAAVLPVLRSGVGYNFIEATVNETSPASFAISLTSTESNVVDRRHCPVFVKCYETEALNGPYSVSLRLGSLSIPDFEFQVTSNSEFISDVGGVLDLSPKGRIAMESLILFQAPSEDSTTGQPARSCSDLGCEESGAIFMSFDDQGKTSYDDNFVRLPLVDDHKLSSWIVSGVRMSIAALSFNTAGMDVEIDPFHPFITFPDSMFDSIFRSLRHLLGDASINPSTRTVEIPCGYSGDDAVPVLTIVSDDGSIRVPLRMRNIPMSYQDHWMCTTVINFDDTTDRIILGSPLLDNRNGIVFDAVEKTVLVGTKDAAYQPQSVIPRNVRIIPTYQMKS